MKPFHLALPVPSLDHVKDFYIKLLACEKGRSDNTWVDLNLYGHQLVFHVVPGIDIKAYYNPVDKHQVPIPHFGVVLKPEEWNTLADALKAVNTEFIIEPYTRFKGEVGEQSTLFFKDPVGYHLEFKAFENMSQLFAS